MTIEQTIEVPANRRITLEVPPQIPLGKVILAFTPALDNECPLCAKSHTPNAETAAAIREGRAMLKGEVPAKWYNSLDEMWEDLEKDDDDN
jgi:hypothetical protein